MRAILTVLAILLASTPLLGARAQGSDDVCSSLLVPAIQQVGLEPVMSAGVLGCTYDGSAWSMRTVMDTQPGANPRVLDERGVHIQSLIDTMGMDAVFTNTLRFDRSTSTIYTVGAGGNINSSSIANEGLGAGPNWLNNYRSLYTNAMEVYLINSSAENPELVQYMEWFMARRDVTLQAMSGGMNPMSETAFLSNWGFQQFPWFWQMADPIAIGSFVEEVLQTTSTDSEDSTAGEQNDGSSLALSPSEIIAQPGDVVLVEIEFPRLQGIHSVAFMVYGERMWVNNLPMAYVDTEGSFACSEGHAGDIVPPDQRALDVLTTPNYPPTFLELEIDPSARPGDRLSLCVEMIGFSLDQEVFAWNARIDIEVAG